MFLGVYRTTSYSDLKLTGRESKKEIRLSEIKYERTHEIVIYCHEKRKCKVLYMGRNVVEIILGWTVDKEHSVIRLKVQKDYSL